MTWHWKEVLPVDPFSVRLADFISDIDLHLLTLLYQPLIGAKATGLYRSLLSQLPTGMFVSDRHTHQHLSLMLGEDMAELLEARKKLEAIDLLRTYQRKDEQERFFVYELQPPMKPHVFFNDDVLSVFLFNRLGKKGYRAIRERFLLERIDYTAFEEVTQSFSDVFTSLTHSEMQPKLMDEGDEAYDGDQTEVIGCEKAGLTFKGFDFELMKQSLSSFIVPDELLTSDMIELINKLAFVYQVESLTMANLIERAALGESLQANDLRETIQTWYKLESSSQAPALGLRSQPVGQRTVVKEPTTEEERVTLFYEETAPITLLEMRQDGASVAPADVKIIEELIVDYMLNPGVVNVMIDSVLFRNDMKLSRPFLLKIAGHWKRKKIKTVPEAMRLVKEDKQKQTEAMAKKTNTSRRNSRQDKLPKWLVQEQSEKANQASSNELEEPEDVQAAKQEIASLMEERKRRRAQKGES